MDDRLIGRRYFFALAASAAAAGVLPRGFPKERRDVVPVILQTGGTLPNQITTEALYFAVRVLNENGRTRWDLISAS